MVVVKERKVYAKDVPSSEKIVLSEKLYSKFELVPKTKKFSETLAKN